MFLQSVSLWLWDILTLIKYSRKGCKKFIHNYQTDWNHFLLKVDKLTCNYVHHLNYHHALECLYNTCTITTTDCEQTKSLVTNDSEERILMFCFKMAVIKCASSTKKKKKNHSICSVNFPSYQIPSQSFHLTLNTSWKIIQAPSKDKISSSDMEIWKCFIFYRTAPQLRGHKIAILGEGEGSPRRRREKCVNQ